MWHLCTQWSSGASIIASISEYRLNGRVRMRVADARNWPL